MLFSSMTSQTHAQADCAENEYFSTFFSDPFCCDIEKENDTVIVEFPGTLFERHQRYLAPNVCFYAPRKGVIISNCICNEGFDFKSKGKIPSETTEQKIAKMLVISARDYRSSGRLFGLFR